MGSRPPAETLEVPFYPAVCTLCPGRPCTSEGCSFTERRGLLGSSDHFHMQVLGCWELYGSQTLSSPFSNVTFSVIQLQTPLSLAFSPREPDQGILRTKPHLPSLSMQVNLHISCVQLHSPHMGHLE